MLNIHFNNTSYNISEAALNAASERIKAHLSTVMNGTGAVINFGGTSYNIDSTKLSAATNTLVSHIGTIAGGDTLTWDGNREGLEVFADAPCYRVSDVIPTADDLANGGTVRGDIYGTGEEIKEFTVVFDSEINAFYLSVEKPNASFIAVVIIPSDTTMDGFALKAGTYFFDGDGKPLPKVRSLQINGYTGFPSSDNNGTKVVVNEVEYFIDPTKIEDAVSELETVLGGLHEPDVVIVLDEAILDSHVLG